MTKENLIKEFVENLDMPSWAYINGVKFEYGKIIITYCDYYYISICVDYYYEDGISADKDISWGKRDIEFALNIFDKRDEILEMFNN